jgi:hypothetical protein
LRLVPSFVDFARVVNLLDDVELDLDLTLARRTSTIATNLSRLLIVVFDIWLSGFR